MAQWDELYDDLGKRWGLPDTILPRELHDRIEAVRFSHLLQAKDLWQDFATGMWLESVEWRGRGGLHAPPLLPEVMGAICGGPGLRTAWELANTASHRYAQMVRCDATDNGPLPVYLSGWAENMYGRGAAWNDPAFATMENCTQAFPLLHRAMRDTAYAASSLFSLHVYNPAFKAEAHSALSDELHAHECLLCLRECPLTYTERFDASFDFSQPNPYEPVLDILRLGYRLTYSDFNVRPPCLLLQVPNLDLLRAKHQP